MRRRLVLGVLAVALAGGAGLVVQAASSKRPDVFSLGVNPVHPVATLAANSEACQSPVGIPDPVERVRVILGPFGAPRGPARVLLRADGPRGKVLAQGTIERRSLPSGPIVVTLDRRVDAGVELGLCVRNEGDEHLEVIGDIDSHTGLALPKRFAGRVLHNPTRTTDDLYVDGKVLRGGGFEMTASFPAPEPRSLLELLPAAFEHAARFKPPLVGAWTYWVLLAMALIAAPLLLGRALAAAVDEEEAQP